MASGTSATRAVFWPSRATGLSSEEREIMRQAVTGRTGQARAAWVPTACPPQPPPWSVPDRQAQPRPRGSCSSGSACEPLGPPGFPRGTQEGARPCSRPPACWGPGRSCRGLWSRACEVLPWFWKSQPHLCSQLHSKTLLVPVRCTLFLSLSPLQLACSVQRGQECQWREMQRAESSVGERAG